MAKEAPKKQQMIAMIPAILGMFAGIAVMRSMGHGGALVAGLYGAVGGGVGGAIGYLLLKVMGQSMEED